MKTYTPIILCGLMVVAVVVGIAKHGNDRDAFRTKSTATAPNPVPSAFALHKPEPFKPAPGAATPATTDGYHTQLQLRATAAVTAMCSNYTGRSMSFCRGMSSSHPEMARAVRNTRRSIDKCAAGRVEALHDCMDVVIMLTMVRMEKNS